MSARRLNILIYTGQFLPRPAPSCVIDGFLRAEITQDAQSGDGFQLTFSLTKNAIGEYTILQSGALDPFSRVVLAVEFGALPIILIDGIVTHHQIDTGKEAFGATLIVTGKDLSVMMDLTQQIKKYDNQPDSLIVTQLLARYARYKLTPMVMPTLDVPIMVCRTPWQTETDLACIKRLAQRNGYVFHITPLLPGVVRAYFGPESRAAAPQHAIALNLGGDTNVESIHFSHDAFAPMQVRGHYLDPLTKIVVPVPAPPFVAVPPLALKPTRARRQSFLARSAHLPMPNVTRQAMLAGQSSRDALTAEGELEPLRYGGVLKVRGLVGVRGAGLSYDGFYFVRKTTHKVERGKYLQSFTLCREGTVPTSPVVVP